MNCYPGYKWTEHSKGKDWQNGLKKKTTLSSSMLYTGDNRGKIKGAKGKKKSKSGLH